MIETKKTPKSDKVKLSCLLQKALKSRQLHFAPWRRQPMRYESIEPISLTAAESALSGVDLDQLRRAVVAVGLYEMNFASAFRFLMQTASHADSFIRGNTLVSFGHLARRFGELDERSVRPFVERGLFDKDDFVHGQAHAAADDLSHFLGWQFPTVQ